MQQLIKKKVTPNDSNIATSKRFLLYHIDLQLTLKGTNGRRKTYEISHVYSIFYFGFMCQTTVVFGITKDGSLY